MQQLAGHEARAAGEAVAAVVRYVGTGEGAWHGGWYVYAPSADDRALARRIGAATAERVLAAGRQRSGYGDQREARAGWYVSGFLGEVAALRPFDSGPDLRAWEGGAGWFGSPDYRGLEVRTTTTWQLYGFALRGKDGAGLGGWRVSAKDRGRTLLCVAERGAQFVVMGYVHELEVPRLEQPLGRIVAVVSPDMLTPYRELFA